MKSEISAKVYAKALLKLNVNVETVINSFETVSYAVKNSSDLCSAMCNPIVDVKIKKEILDDVFKTKIDNNILNFLKILIDKNRFSEILQIIDEYKAQVDELNNIKKVNVISAIQLNDNQKERIVSLLQKKLNKTVVVDWTLNDEIIAGLMIKIDDDVIDDSLKNKLDKICS